MEFTKSFIMVYVIFVALLFMFGVNTQYTNISNPPSLDDFTFFGVLEYVGNFIIFIWQIITFTTNFKLVDIILWGCRIICIIEIVLYLKQALNPVAN